MRNFTVNSIWFFLNFHRVLEGRDPDYQKLAVKGLITSSKRVLSGTKDSNKINAIKEGVKVLEEFLEKFDNENRSRLNCAYLSVDVITQFPVPKDKLQAEFLDVYKSKKNYKHLRVILPEDDDDNTWDVIRNKNVWKIKDHIKEKDLKLWNDNGEPSEEHLKLIYWAYSPQPDKVKAYLEKNANSSSKGEKRKSDAGGNETVSKKKK